MNKKDIEEKNYIEIQLDPTELGYQVFDNQHNNQLPTLHNKRFYPRRFQLIQNSAGSTIVLQARENILEWREFENSQNIMQRIEYKSNILYMDKIDWGKEDFLALIIYLEDGSVYIVKIIIDPIIQIHNQISIDLNQVKQNQDQVYIQFVNQIQGDQSNKENFFVFYIFNQTELRLQFFKVNIDEDYNDNQPNIFNNNSTQKSSYIKAEQYFLQPDQYQIFKIHEPVSLQYSNNNILSATANFFKNTIFGAQQDDNQKLDKLKIIKIEYLCGNIFILIREDFSIQLFDIYQKKYLWYKINYLLDEQILDLQNIRILKDSYEDQNRLEIIIYDENYISNKHNNSFYIQISIKFVQDVDILDIGINEFGITNQDIINNIEFKYHQFTDQKITYLDIVEGSLLLNIYNIIKKTNEIKQINLFGQPDDTNYFTLDLMALKCINDLKILLEEIECEQYDIFLKKLFSQNCFTFQDLYKSTEIASTQLDNKQNEIKFMLVQHDIQNKFVLLKNLSRCFKSFLIQNQSYQIKEVLTNILQYLVTVYQDENEIINIQKIQNRIYTFRENKKQSIFDLTIPFIARYMKVCSILNNNVYSKDNKTQNYFSKVKQQPKVILNKKNITLERLFATVLSNFSEHDESDFIYHLQIFNKKGLSFQQKLENFVNYKFMNLKKVNKMKILQQLVQNKIHFQDFIDQYFKLQISIEKYSYVQHNNQQHLEEIDIKSQVNIILQEAQMNYYFETDFAIALILMLLNKFQDIITQIFGRDFLKDLKHIQKSLESKIFGYFCLNSYYNINENISQNESLKTNSIMKYIIRDKIRLKKIQNFQGQQWLNIDQIEQNYMIINQLINSQRGFYDDTNILNLFYFYLFKKNQQGAFNSNIKYFCPKNISFYYFRLLFSKQKDVYKNLQKFFEILYQNKSQEPIFVQQLQFAGEIAEYTAQNIQREEPMQKIVVQMILNGKIEIFDFDQLFQISLYLIVLCQDDYRLKDELLQNLISKMGTDKVHQNKILSLLSTESQTIIDEYCQRALNIEDPSILEFQNLQLSHNFQIGFLNAFENLIEQLKTRIKKRNLMTFKDCSENFLNQFMNFCRNLTRSKKYLLVCKHSLLLALQCFQILDIVYDKQRQTIEFQQLYLNMIDQLSSNALLFQKYLSENESIEYDINQIDQYTQRLLDNLNINQQISNKYVITKNNLQFINAYFKGIKKYFELKLNQFETNQKIIVAFLTLNQEVNLAYQMSKQDDELMKILFNLSFVNLLEQQQKHLQDKNIDSKSTNVIEAQVQLLTLNKGLDEQQRQKNQITYLKSLYEFEKRKEINISLNITEEIEKEVFKRDPMKLIIYQMTYNQQKKLKDFADQFIEILKEISEDPQRIRTYKMNYLNTKILSCFFNEMKKKAYEDKYDKIKKALEDIASKGL